MCGAGVGGKCPLEALGLRARGDPSRAERFEHRALVVGINAWLVEGKKRRPDWSSAVYCQSGVNIDFHVNCIILGSLRTWVNDGFRGRGRDDSTPASARRMRVGSS